MQSLVKTKVKTRKWLSTEKMHIGGTFVERLSGGDKVAVTRFGKYDFVYSGEGGGPLTFRGELITHSELI